MITFHNYCASLVLYWSTKGKRDMNAIPRLMMQKIYCAVNSFPVVNFLKYRCPKWALELNIQTASQGDKNVKTSGLLSSATDKGIFKSQICAMEHMLEGAMICRVTVRIES